MNQNSLAKSKITSASGAEGCEFDPRRAHHFFAFAGARERVEWGKGGEASAGGATMKNKSAFTLIEILVVLGVIGLLAAILVPAVSSGMAKARRAQCLGNMRSVGTSLSAYGLDHKGRMPDVTSVTDLAKDLFEDGYLENLEAWACPADGERTACHGADADSFNSKKNSSYIYFSGYNPLSVGDVNSMPLLCSRSKDGGKSALTDLDNHGRVRNVVYLGGAAASLKGDAANDIVKKELPDGVTLVE